MALKRHIFFQPESATNQWKKGRFGPVLNASVLPASRGPGSQLYIDTTRACLPCLVVPVASVKGTRWFACFLHLFLEYRGKDGLKPSLSRRYCKRYPGRGLGSPWILQVPACRARFARQKPWKGRGVCLPLAPLFGTPKKRRT